MTERKLGRVQKSLMTVVICSAVVASLRSVCQTLVLLTWTVPNRRETNDDHDQCPKFPQCRSQYCDHIMGGSWLRVSHQNALYMSCCSLFSLPANIKVCCSHSYFNQHLPPFTYIIVCVMCPFVHSCHLFPEKCTIDELGLWPLSIYELYHIADQSF